MTIERTPPATAANHSGGLNRLVVAGGLAAAGLLALAVDLPVAEWFRDHDLLLCPNMGPAQTVELAAEVSQRSGPPQSFNVPFNHAYNPAAAVPFGFHSNGLPLAVQLVGRLGDDVGVLRASAAIEAARPWGHRWPALAEQA